MAALNAARPASSPTFSLEVTNVTDRGKWGTHTTLIIRFGKSENAVPKPRNNKLLILTKLLMVMNLFGHNYPILTVAIVTQQINSLTPGDRWVRLNTPYIYIYIYGPSKKNGKFDSRWTQCKKKDITICISAPLTYISQMATSSPTNYRH